MTIALLVVILIVAAISMVFNIAYIMHELGWFPHGKRRDERSELFPTPIYGNLIATEAYVREQHDLVTDHPSSIRLRRTAHREVYEYDDPAAKLREVLQRANDNPTASTIDDLITLSNVIGSRSDPTEEVQRLLSIRIIDFLQEREVRAQGGQA